MKKLTVLLLVLVLAISLTACGGKNDPKPSDNQNNPQQQETNKPDGEKTDDTKKALVAKKGDIASFGNYDDKDIQWLCLAIQEDKALLITKDCIRLDIFNEPLPDGSQVL